MRLAIVASHPVQYYAPLYRELSRQLDLKVFYVHRDTAEDQARAGFGVRFAWDVDLLSGYASEYLDNVARRPAVDHFFGCDTPSIGAALRDGGYDAVLVQGWHLKALLQALAAAKRLSIPVIARGDSHLGTPRSAIKNACKEILYPAFLGLYDAALFVGERSRDYWRHYRYPSDRLFFSPHSVDTQWFAARATAAARAELRGRLGIAHSDKVVLFAGKLVPFKRPLDLPLALAALRPRFPEITLLVAGAGELETQMRSLSSDLGVRHHFLGFCNQTEMPAAYACADLLVVPSDGRETWGLVANEALACGVSIAISSDVGCGPDLAADGTAGLVFPTGDIQRMSKAVGDLLECPPSADAIRRKRDKYSLSTAAEGICGAVAWLIERGHRAPRQITAHGSTRRD